MATEASRESVPFTPAQSVSLAPPRLRIPWKWLVAGGFGVALTVFSSVAELAEPPLFAGAILFTVFALWVTVWLLRAMARAWHKDRVALAMGAGALSLTGLMMSGFGAILALVGAFGFRRGRQLRRGTTILLPPVADAGEPWARLPLATDVTNLPAGLAEQWRDNGRTEHASVGAFARLTLDLMALGAPPRLIHDANRDARDEIRHTELCFALARALDGRAAGPDAFPDANRARSLLGPRSVALAQLAVDSLIDGALHEGVSAAVVARLVRRCTVPAIRDVLKEIAADEGRHAAHGWDVVEWCVAEGGAGVRDALLGALRALPDEMRSPLPADAEDGSWERYGVPGRALESGAYARAKEQLTRRVLALCDAARAAA